eukprot:1705993-Amphidinium_carterae.1
MGYTNSILVPSRFGALELGGYIGSYQLHGRQLRLQKFKRSNRIEHPKRSRAEQSTQKLSHQRQVSRGRLESHCSVQRYRSVLRLQERFAVAGIPSNSAALVAGIECSTAQSARK